MQVTLYGLKLRRLQQLKYLEGGEYRILVGKPAGMWQRVRLISWEHRGHVVKVVMCMKLTQDCLQG
jgi:hypothetical protein